MIRELTEYTYNHNLIVRPGYGAKTVKWAIDVTSQGSYLGVIQLGDVTQRNNRGLEFKMAPQLEQSELIAGGQTRSHFLVETVAVVANMPDEKNKIVLKHQFFIETLGEASKSVPELHAWVSALRQDVILVRIREDLMREKAKPTDRITVRVDGRFLLDTTVWHEWWEGFRAELDSSEAQDRIGYCLVTGQEGRLAVTHPRISGLAGMGGNPTGSVLVSFDKDAFGSYGLVQGENAPIGIDAAVAYQSALNDLIDKGIDLAGMKVLYWYRDPVALADDPLAFLGRQPAESQEREVLSEAQETLTALARPSHYRPGVDSGNRFYLLILSAVSARVMIRGWREGAYEDLKINVDRWFSDVALVSRGGTLPPPFSLFALLRQLSVGGRDIPAPHARALWEAAVLGRPIPLAVVSLALQRMRHDVVTGDFMPDRALGLLRAFVIRQKGKVKPMTPGLDLERPETAYHLGRLLAVLARLQTADGGSVRAGLASRYFSSASTTPAVVFGRLLALSPHYLDRIDSKGLRYWHHNQIVGVMSRINEFPRTLTLEDQALFALGYYHQLAHHSERDDRKETE